MEIGVCRRLGNGIGHQQLQNRQEYMYGASGIHGLIHCRQK